MGDREQYVDACRFVLVRTSPKTRVALLGIFACLFQ